MITLSPNFVTLLKKASSNTIVAKEASGLPQSFSNKKERDSAIKELGLKIVESFSKAGITPEQVDPAVKKLISHISDVSSATVDLECKPPIGISDLSFEKIAGLNSVKEQLDVNYIKPPVYPKLFQKIAKGILFYGPPGTGKTILAKAATAEIPKAAFFGPTPGELKGKYEGETEKNINLIFDCAQNLIDEESDTYSISIIFLDEFDSIGGKRDGDPGMTRSVNALLQAMDGINVRENVSVIAATNYPSSLDDAILRRFTTRIFVDLPDPIAREYLIRKALSDAYGDPNSSPKEKEKTIRDSEGDFITGAEAPYMENIRKYGGYIGKTAGFFGFSAKTEDKYIDDPFIGEIIDKFGPAKVGQDIINEITSGKDVSLDDSRLDVTDHIFGYSPSDITKIMDMAIKYAATRAMHSKAVSTTIGGKNYFVVSIDDKGKEVLSMNSLEAAKVLNFDIRRSDVERAMKSMASTVDNKRYVELLKYSKST